MNRSAGMSSDPGFVKPVIVRAGDISYEALIGAGLLQRVGHETARVLRGPRCAVIADANTAGLYGEPVMHSLKEAGFAPTLVSVPPGEGAKTLEQLGRVCDAMSEARLDRTSFVVALGGGVIGDLAGFAAAVFHRGVPHVQVPTTLLAQVDSSIGGKTAVNTAAGKNLLGAVHQPALVVSDVDVLRTLPPRELRQGFAEIIKHAVIADPALLDVVATPAAIDFAAVVRRNVEIKAAVVARDDRDLLGQRAVLNFGHTIGHGIERAGDYRRFLHGEAISLGILGACEVSVRRAGFTEAERRKVFDAISGCGLPTRLPADVSSDAITAALAADKKFERGEIRFVVTPRLGAAHLTDAVTMDDLSAAIAKLR
jgi:3-dehydroquinate synthase